MIEGKCLRSLVDLLQFINKSVVCADRSLNRNIIRLFEANGLKQLAPNVFHAAGLAVRDLPLSGKLQSDLIQLEHRTPGAGVENGITPCRLSACSMLSSVETTLVGGLLPLFSQYRTDRG